MEIKVLSCPLCSESHFENVQILRNALIEVTKKPLNCPICDEIILGLDKFTIHLFTHCSINNEDTVADNLKKAVNNNDSNNNETENNCIINNNSNENEHQIMEYNNENNLTLRPLPYCEICNFDFTDLSMLEMHRTLLHSNGFSCHLCQKKFKMHGSLMVHMRMAHFGFKNKVIMPRINDGATVVSKQLNEESQVNNLSTLHVQTSEAENLVTQKVADNKQWECEECLKKFTTKYFLKKHKRLHTGEMPYECTLCNKSFTFQQSYHKHMLYHSADKPHTCNECGRAFKELSTLHNHQRIHSGERPFGCETCGKRFRQRVSYLVHKRIHTGAMPYKCTSCDKSFRYKVSQRTHKCKAQPPGSVVRQFGDLVQKLLQNQTKDEMERMQEEPSTSKMCAVSDPEVNTNSNSHSENIQTCPDVNTDFFGLVMSPTFQITSDQLESLCLTNKETVNDNSNELFTHLQPETVETNSVDNISRQECSTINEECLKQLLYSSPN